MPLMVEVVAAVPMLTVPPPLPPPRLFNALAMSAASAYLIGMTSEMISDSPPPVSTWSINSSIRFTFSAWSRRMSMPLSSSGVIEPASFANGVRICCIELALT